jgi:hypothetical protein
VSEQLIELRVTGRLSHEAHEAAAGREAAGE